MDAIHYDKIADKLIQFHSKLPQEVDLEDKQAIRDVQIMKKKIDKILKHIDMMAKLDSMGYIR
jgi:hypothetical protein